MLSLAAARAAGPILTLFLSLATGSATALDGIDLSTTAEAHADAEGECPRLIQIKYPFLECRAGQIGATPGHATWENTRRIPIGGDWTEGDGYWGPSPNDPDVPDSEDDEAEAAEE